MLKPSSLATVEDDEEDWEHVSNKLSGTSLSASQGTSESRIKWKGEEGRREVKSKGGGEKIRAK